MPAIRLAGLLIALVAFSPPALAQSVAAAVFPSEETRAAVCQYLVTNPVSFPEEGSLFTASAYLEPIESPTVHVSVLPPIKGLAQHCNASGRLGHNRSVEDLLTQTWVTTSDTLGVLVERIVGVDEAVFALNNLAQLIVRDSGGSVAAVLDPDPWRSYPVSEGVVFPRDTAYPGRLLVVSHFVFDILDPEFRSAVLAGGSVHVRWRAGYAHRGEWEWPVGYADCAEDRLPRCLNEN